MDLLQEMILANRVRTDVWHALCPGQSGYMRGTEDPVLVMQELGHAYYSSQRCLYAILGDYVKAFPRCWREDLLCIVGEKGAIRGGSLFLLGSREFRRRKAG